MAFQNSSAWLPNSSIPLVNGEVCYGTSTRDNKRGHQWFLDAFEEGLYFNKRQAIEPLKDASGRAVMDSSLWIDGSISQSDCPDDPLFNIKPVQNSVFLNENGATHSSVSAAVDTPNNGFLNQSENDSSVCLTVSHAMADPLCLSSGLRRVEVSEVRMLDSYLHELVENSCNGEKDKTVNMGYHSLMPSDSMIPLPTYNIADGNTMSVNPAISTMDKNFISVGQTGKRDGSFMLTNQIYNGMDNNALSVGQAFSRGNYNFSNIGEQNEKENSSFTSIGGPTYSGSYQNFFSVDPYSRKVNESVVPACSTYSEGQRNVVIRNQQDASVGSLQAHYNDENSSISSMVENVRKGDQTTISFGGFQDKFEERNHYDQIIGSYGALLANSSVESPGVLGAHNPVEVSSNVAVIATGRTDNAQKNKELKSKKGSSSNFPTNVKSLLSTGIFDGVPVKYASWSREKNLRGIVKGTGYLCGCHDCKLSKVINAYEFERHAGCKTKHPNNHIYFENGKTIYAVVQELKNTPQDKLFDVIQHVTGSTVNENNFTAWKASYRAATRELQRIYGKDDVVVPS
ncbi:uncharacterized protein LOC127250485 [Andrographis paniculata]|uniref:uncharacterized protein LOC127250485 n=1 Tax=Andrographis paniculata TaxID=175694 RepID=UPI0021E7AF9E|nr:uncharacterized protein LOC127250485 [Andrographis paniculata]XP_051129752.1 uncharacterized protein LOC127250485 [Andrographis paniculata]